MGIREAILVIIVGFFCLAALVRPRIGLYGYIWYALLRPDVLAWVGNEYPFSAALAIATILGSIQHLAQVPRLFRNPISRWLILLQVPVGLSFLFAVNRQLSVSRYQDYVQMIAVLLLIPILITTEEQLRRLLLIMALSLGFLGTKFGVYGLVHGGVILAGGYGGMLSDNNLVALAFAMVVPLCWYSRQLTSSYWLKMVLLGMALSSSVAIVMTNSRGGSLSLGVGFLIIIFRSKYKLVTALLLFLMAGTAIYLVQNTYISRMSTLEHPEEERSAASRMEYAQTAIRMWMDYPILGVGFGGLNYATLSVNYTGRVDMHVVHNSYLQMLVDSGIFAFLIYIGLLFGTILWLEWQIIKQKKERYGSEIVLLAIQTPLIVFAVDGSFYSSQRYDFPYMLLMCAACWYLLKREQRDAVQAGVSAPALAGSQLGEGVSAGLHLPHINTCGSLNW